MLLVIDVGNTNTIFGVFDDMDLVVSFTLSTGGKKTTDEYGAVISELLRLKNIDIKKIKSAVISSVVPKLMNSFIKALNLYFDIDPLVVGTGVKTGIKIVTPNPKEIGADRISDAVGGFEIYGGPVLVLDFGTAITYDLITEDGAFIAGVTSPGLRISADALWGRTAKLPEIEIELPDTILAKDTVTSMQAGLVYGAIGQTEYIVNRMIEESGLKDVKVIATGGMGKLISDNTDVIQVYDPNLTLKGLKIIYDKNKAGR